MKLNFLSFLGKKDKKAIPENTDILFTRILEEVKGLRSDVDRLEQRITRLGSAATRNNPETTAPGHKTGHAPSSEPDDKNDILHSLKEFLANAGEDENSVARKTGLLPVNIRNILNGRHNLSNKVAKKIAAAYGLNQEYLNRGTGKLTSYPSSGKGNLKRTSGREANRRHGN